MKNAITSIDIGSHNVRGVVGYVNQETGELNVVACHSVVSRGVREGEIIDMQSTSNAIRNVIKNLETRTTSPITEVYVAIPGKNLAFYKKEVNHIRPNAEQEITRAELKRYRDNIANVNIPQGQKIIDIIPISYCLDEKQTPHGMPYGLDCRELKGFYNIVTCQERAYRFLERCVNKAGLNIKGTVLGTEATAYACLTESERKAGSLIIDFGGGMTYISIFKDGLLVDMHVFEIGGHIITQDIVEGCKILVENAEKLKTRYGCAMMRPEQVGVHVGIDGLHTDEIREISIHNLAQIVHFRVKEMAMIVDELIELTGMRDDLITGIFLTGGTARLNSIKDAFAEITALPVRTKNVLQYNAKPDIVRALNSSFSVALGTLIKVAKDEAIANEALKAKMQLERKALVKKEAEKAKISTAEQPALDNIEQNDTVEEEKKKGSWVNRWLNKFIPQANTHNEDVEEDYVEE